MLDQQRLTHLVRFSQSRVGLATTSLNAPELVLWQDRSIRSRGCRGATPGTIQLDKYREDQRGPWIRTTTQFEVYQSFCSGAGARHRPSDSASE
jgi:hypothetical protein